MIKQATRPVAKPSIEKENQASQTHRRLSRERFQPLERQIAANGKDCITTVIKPTSSNYRSTYSKRKGPGVQANPPTTLEVRPDPVQRQERSTEQCSISRRHHQAEDDRDSDF